MSSRALHLDAFSGIAGNMLLGALFDAGLSRQAWDAALAGLDLDYRLVVRRVRRGAIAARHVAVRCPRSAAAAPGRSLADVCGVLRGGRLAAAVLERAVAAFELLARAESAVHGVPVERVHFHEVGAVDAIVDIAGAAAALHCLGVNRVTCSPLALGHGSVETEHGRLPLPRPRYARAPARLPGVRGRGRVGDRHADRGSAGARHRGAIYPGAGVRDRVGGLRRRGRIAREPSPTCCARCWEPDPAGAVTGCTSSKPTSTT